MGLGTVDDMGTRYLVDKVWGPNPSLQKCQRLIALTLAKINMTVCTVDALHGCIVDIDPLFVNTGRVRSISSGQPKSALECSSRKVELR